MSGWIYQTKLWYIFLQLKINDILLKFIYQYLCHFITLCRCLICLLSIRQFFISTFLQYFVLWLSKDTLVGLCSRITKLFHCHYLQSYSLQGQYLSHKFNRVDSMDPNPKLKQNWIYVVECSPLIRKILPYKKYLQRM